MGSPADYKYFVIDAPYEGIDEFVCIPWTWIVSRTGHDVVVSYPVENPSDTEQRVEYGEGISKEWKSYESVVRGAFYSYDQAKLIASKMNKLHHYQDCLNEECGLCAVLENESWECLMKTIHSSEQGAYSKQDIDKSLEFDVSSKNDDRSATNTRLKQTPQSNLHAEAAKVVEPAGSVNEVAEQLCQAFECPNENSSLEPITMTDPELFTVISTSFRELHKSSNTNHSVMDIVLKTLNMNDKVMKEQAKLIVELRAALASKVTTAVVEKTPKKKTKKQKALDDEDDDHEVVKKKRYRPKIILPPEYNENDSRWTLKHHKLIPGLVELMPNSNVYIDSIQLIHCKRLGKDCRSLARLLMPDIFTKNALKVCSLTGTRARAYDVKGAFIRPGLDENARNAILDFVEEYGREKGWRIQENQSTLIKNGMRNLVKQIREKYG